MNYEAADRCHDCPERNDAKGCPWWWEVIQQEGGNFSTIKRCGKAWFPEILVEFTKSLNRIPEAVNQMRNTLDPLLGILDEHSQITMVNIHGGIKHLDAPKASVDTD